MAPLGNAMRLIHREQTDFLFRDRFPKLRLAKPFRGHEKQRNLPGLKILQPLFFVLSRNGGIQAGRPQPQSPGLINLVLH